MQIDDDYFEELLEKSPYKLYGKELIRKRFYLALAAMEDYLYQRYGLMVDTPRRTVKAFNDKTPHKLNKFLYEIEYILVAKQHFLNTTYQKSIKK